VEIIQVQIITKYSKWCLNSKLSIFCQISNRKVTFNNHFEIILTPLSYYDFLFCFQGTFSI